MFVLNITVRWTPLENRTHPEHLHERFPELPPVDMFVTTADSTLEPPIITTDTILSLLAVDYPAHKLTCYVSDDGASLLAYFSLVQASEFGKLWVPFCKKYKVKVRAPSAYFSMEPQAPEGEPFIFFREWKQMKDEYQGLRQRIEAAADNNFLLASDSAVFSKIEQGNHPSIVKVIWENKENHPEAMPNLVYVAREKRPKCPHHYKAGAMNVLTRVSGVMTNAPFMLNVDCDMFVNNPQIALDAMCLLLGTESEAEIAFVQTPQVFHNCLKDDPFGNNMIVAQEIFSKGMGGIQGPCYAGTGCFHRRKIIYGQHPGDAAITGKWSEDILRKMFGSSKQFRASAMEILRRSADKEEVIRGRPLSSAIDAAAEVASCSYEINTSWGDEVGWVYGSCTEDVLTGIKIHSMGWKSAYFNPVPPAFLGCAPTGGPAILVQMKRWCTGLQEILFTKYSPLWGALKKKMQLRQSLAYLLFVLWGPRSLPEMCYSLLPAYCLLADDSFLPKITDPSMAIPAAIFIFRQLCGVADFLAHRQSVRAWWNTQRMSRITSSTAQLLSNLSVFLKLLGLSETLFEVTPKEEASAARAADADVGRFTFDASPVIIPGVALVLVHMAALALEAWKLTRGGGVARVGEMVCSAWILLCFLPFVKGLYGRGRYGIPWVVVVKAAAVALLFINFCSFG